MYTGIASGDRGTNRRRRAFAGVLAAAFLLVIPVLSCLEPTSFLLDEGRSGAPQEDPPGTADDTGDPNPDAGGSEEPGDSGPGFILMDDIIKAIGDISPATGAEAETVIRAQDFMGDIAWDKPLDKGKFKPFVNYTATISLYPLPDRALPPAETEVAISGALSSSYDAAGSHKKITATFPRTHQLVTTVSGLNAAIQTVQSAAPGDENVIELTRDFYADANKSATFITIDAGDADNLVPYTIRGQGKDSDEVLNVGILLANNKVTLEGIRLSVSESNKAVPKQWGDKSSYRAALLIGRYTSPPSLDDHDITTAPGGAQSKQVTVRDCKIDFTYDGSMIAGILVRSGAGPIEDISIADNEIGVDTLGTTYAAQALLIYGYAPTLSITGNWLKSSNKAAKNANSRPAGALFMQINPAYVAGFYGVPLISGNKINGNPTYDFYINIYSHGDRVGVPEMAANGFATPDSTWMTADSSDTGSFYKKLIDTLLPQIRTGAGYGYLAMYLGGTANAFSGDCVFEAYMREYDRLTAIDFWGYKIENGEYSTTDCRARLELNPGGHVTKKDALFHWTANEPGDNIP